VVCKPTVDGWVTSVEVYDNKDELIVQFFGARKPGSPELNAWRKLLRQYCQNDLVTDSVIHECLSRGQAVN
jgi:putative hemin transport protein